MYTTQNLKVSYKMRKAIEKLENKYGTLNKNYGIESGEAYRVGRNFYDYCELTSNILRNLKFTVNHDGSVFNS